MRTVKWSAFLSGLCGVAVALGMATTSVHATVTTERGASILAFPKVLVDNPTDTLIQISNLSNNMVHARCFYVNAALDDFGQPQWQVTDFIIWLTKQQATHWRVSTGRFVNPLDTCIVGGLIVPSAACADAGLDPGAIPPVPQGFMGELKCVEVNVDENPWPGNHLKGEATIKVGGDVAKYNALGFLGTDRAGETGNELRLDQPSDTEDPVGQYNACPNELIVNHLAEGVTDPVVLQEGFGGICVDIPAPPAQEGTAPVFACQTDDDCDVDQECVGGAVVDPGPPLQLTSATVTDLTLVPCSQDFENSIPGRVTVQFLIINVFENRFSASTTIDCWRNFHLFEVDSPNDPMQSVFSYAVLGTTVAQTRIRPVTGQGGIIGVAGALRADARQNTTRTALNIHMVGDRLTGTLGEVVDTIILPGH